MAIFVGLIPQFHYVKKCKYLKIMVWGPTSRASAKSTKLFDRLKPMNSYRVISQLTYEKEKNQFWELFKNGQCPLATPSQPTVSSSLLVMCSLGWHSWWCLSKVFLVLAEWDAGGGAAQGADVPCGGREAMASHGDNNPGSTLAPTSPGVTVFLLGALVALSVSLGN